MCLGIRITELVGKFHAHMTLRHDVEIEKVHVPGWKPTIILLNKGNKNQVDVMLTRHFVLPSNRYPDYQSIIDELKLRESELIERGFEVLRVKLEHESLPTISPSTRNYRECHIKLAVPHNTTVQYAEPLVASSNPMAVHTDHIVTFLNARFYEGQVDDVDMKIAAYVQQIERDNPTVKVLEIKKESTVMDSNLELDRWWA